MLNYMYNIIYNIDVYLNIFDFITISKISFGGRYEKVIHKIKF